ncbi:MAG: hypothetical protein LBH57_07115, partial [Treponema sp.]|jgi:uroporphyrinogen decarboxylase|nr:hypothetical protein [Treponema sp.]
LKVIAGEIPDCVPVAPDISNMIPAKQTGMPFWDIYLYEKIPIWKAYIDSVKYFGFDSLMDGYVQVNFEELGDIDHESIEVIVNRDESKIVTQKYKIQKGQKVWADHVNAYYPANPPTMKLHPHKIGLPLVPDRWEPISDRVEHPQGEALLRWAKEEMGDHGLVGVTCGISILLHSEQDILDYYDDPGKFHAERDRLLDYYERRLHKLMSLENKPDFICTGGSGTLVFQSPQIFRDLGLPIVQKITALCKKYGIPTHVHSCGPEADLVKIMAEETDLTIIDPLEIPPMGNCNLAEIKRLYGKKLILKGNLHTTNVMLFGTIRDVEEASRKAIDDAGKDGRFILSTGDQCGRDTPEENLFAMINTARTYGQYPIRSVEGS